MAFKKAAYKLQRNRIILRKIRLLKGLLSPNQGGNRSRWTTFYFKRIMRELGCRISLFGKECQNVISTRSIGYRVCPCIKMEMRIKTIYTQTQISNFSKILEKVPIQKLRMWENWTYKGGMPPKQGSSAIKISKASQMMVMIIRVMT